MIGQVRTRFRHFAALAVLAAGIAVMPVNADAQSRKAAGQMETLKPGSWLVRSRDGATKKKICLRSREDLLRLHRDPKQNCRRFLISSDSAHLTVQYSCPKGGYGHTTLRRETAELVQMESEGFRGGLPYSFIGEARRVGSCR